MEDAKNKDPIVALVEGAIEKLDEAKAASETAKAVLRYVVGDLQTDEPAHNEPAPATG